MGTENRYSNDLNKTTWYYRKTFQRRVDQFNKPTPLAYYFLPLIGDKKEVKIAELGAGVINTIGDHLDGVKVTIFASDLFADEYNRFWKINKQTPIVPINYQDFEHLTYPDNYFDIVHMVNSLDHTPNPRAALKEMYRVCKPGGYIYLRHAFHQMDKYHGLHQWNIFMQGEDCIFQSRNDQFKLEGYKTTVEQWEKEKLIVSICQKT